MASEHARDVVRLGRREEEEKREEKECRFELLHCRFRGETMRKRETEEFVFEFLGYGA